jgi:phospholipase/carboxylesterase
MDDPHHGAPVLRMGLELEKAHAAVVLLHGRGGSAEDMLVLARGMYDGRIAYLAPQANGNTWYPRSFLSPIEQNEPWLSSALSTVSSAVDSCIASGVPREKIVLCGFSQGACLASEFAVRHPAHYGALVAFTGGLIGPPDVDLHHRGSLAGTVALFSSGDPDPYVPWSRVEESARELERMGADVELMRHSNRPHAVIPEELDAARTLIFALI